MLQICSTDREDPVSLPRDGACHGVSALADGVSHDVDANVSEQTDEVVRPVRNCKIVATTGYPLQVRAVYRGATTSSGRFAATFRGCRPPFAENRASLSFPDAPGSGARGRLAGGHAANAGRGDDLIRPLRGHLPNPGEGNTGCRPPFVENSALHCFPGAPSPHSGEGNTAVARHALQAAHRTVTQVLRPPQPGKATRAARVPSAHCPRPVRPPSVCSKKYA